MTTGLSYPSEVIEIREGLKRFLDQEVIQRHEANASLLDDERKLFDETGRYCNRALDLIREVRKAASAAGYYTMCVPTALGGGGLGHVAWYGAWEQIFRICNEKYWLGHFAISHWAFGPSAVLTELTPEAREKILPGLSSGETSMCFGMSEPGSGSDAAMMKTTAKQDGTGWRLNGGKIWTTNSPYADYCIVFAITDAEAAAKRKGGVSAFLVPTTAQGFKIEKVIRMWGGIGGNEAILHFDGVRVEPYQLVGKLNRGFGIAMLGVNLGRLYNAARGVGMGRWALELAFDYTQVRHTFGKPISDYQGVTFPLAESLVQIQAAHLLSLDAAQQLDHGIDARTKLAMAKFLATREGAQAVDRAMQAHGAIGMTNELFLTNAYKSLRLVNIADGTNEILKRTIVKEVLADRTLI